MPQLTRSTLRKHIASGDTAPLYMLVGDDDTEKAALAGEFAEMVDEGLRAFNVDRFYGADAGVDDIVEAAATLPMLAPRRIVIVLEAEKLLVPKRETKAADQELARLEAFLEHPSPHATVVFVCGPLDERRRVVKLLRKQAHVVDSGTIEDASDAEMWVKTRAAREGAKLDAGAVRALVQRAGLDIVRLRSGFERVQLYAWGQPTITADDVKESVPAAPEAQEDFGIAYAIRDRDAAAALRQLTAALDAGAAPFFLMGQLRWAAEKMPAARLRAAIEAVFRTDEALKSSGGDPRVLLERLVVELCGETPVGRAFQARRADPQGPARRSR